MGRHAEPAECDLARYSDTGDGLEDSADRQGGDEGRRSADQSHQRSLVRRTPQGISGAPQGAEAANGPQYGDHDGSDYKQLGAYSARSHRRDPLPHGGTDKARRNVERNPPERYASGRQGRVAGAWRRSLRLLASRRLLSSVPGRP